MPSWDATVEAARRVLDPLGAKLLHRDSAPLGDGLTIVGTTLWSHVGGRDASDVRTFIADYRRWNPYINPDIPRRHPGFPYINPDSH